MEEQKFLLGQTVYSAQEFRLGRYIVKEFVTKETEEGITEQVVVEDATGRKKCYSVEDIESSFFATLAEAKELALQNLEVLVKSLREQLTNVTDKTFDDEARDLQEKQKAQGK